MASTDTTTTRTKTAGERRGLKGLLQRMLQRMRGASRATASEPLPQIEAALDGASALAAVEAAVAEAAGLSSRYPATSSVETFRDDVAKADGANAFGLPVAAVSAADARAAMATAVGLSMSGLRATAFLSGASLAGVSDQLVAAVNKHLPLVVHVSCRSTAGPGATLGSGHEGVHAVADSGCAIFFATNVQEAVDLSVVARRVTEQALVPALVCIDGQQTADSLQDVRLPSLELLEAFLGEPAGQIEPPTPGQQLLFGQHRRRVPRLYDLSRPSLSGPHYGQEARGLAAAGLRPYFLDHLPDLIDDALAAFGEASGRHYGLLCEHEVADAELILVGEGSAVETLRAVADELREQSKQRVGVIGVRCLRPLPGAQLAETLRGKRTAFVLERLDTPLSGDPPLLREVRSALQRCLENSRSRRLRHVGYPSFGAGDQPQLSSAVYGLAGHPLRAADLLALASEKPRPSVYLGVDFAPSAIGYPKRQAAIERVRRAYPEVASLGLRSDSGSLMAEAGASAAVFRLADGDGEGVASSAARLVWMAAGSGRRIRGRNDSGWEAWGARRRDWFVYRDGTLRDPGDAPRFDVALITTQQLAEGFDPAADIETNGALIIERGEKPSSDEALWNELPAVTQRSIRQRDLKIFLLINPVADDAKLRDERRVGTVLGALVARGLEIKTRKLVSCHRELLEELGESDIDARNDALANALALEQLSLQRLPVKDLDEREAPVPQLVRRLGGATESIRADSLPAFWNQIGVLYHDNRTEQLFAEPSLSAGVVPPLTATFNSCAAGRQMLPAFDPTLCTGCGRCWVACPEGAIGPLALDGKSLIEAGMALASEAGTDAASLQMLVSKLGPKVAAALRSDPTPTTAGELLAGAPAELIAKAPLPDDRKQAIVAAFEAVSAQLETLPVARTEPLFDVAEKKQPGSGALLSLAINPDACKACGLCVALCEPRALSAADVSPEAEERARRGWALWERMPDTPGETIAAASEQAELGELGALLLSRHCLMAMSGGDGAERGSGTKTSLRLVLAVAEYQLQRELARHLQSVRAVRDEVATKIRDTMADALPAADIEALAEGIEGLGGTHASLKELTERVDKVIEGGKVEVTKLKQLIDNGRELADVQWRLETGPLGLGRARVGMAFAPGTLAQGIGSYPYNPFAVPVAIDSGGEPAAFARGLLEGQLRDVVDELRVVRRARLLMSNPTAAALSDSELRKLQYADLTTEERAVCPPLLLVGKSADFADQDLAPLVDGALPIKIVLLADGGVNEGGEPGDRDALGLLALGGGHSFVLQGSLAFPNHLVDGLKRAFAHDGPAVIQIHAPSPQQHGFASDATVARAAAAVEARLFPLLTFDPTAEGVFGSCLDLTANAALDQDHEGDLDVVSWAQAERRFAHHFSELSDDAAAPTPIAEWIELPPAARVGKTPFVAVPGDEEAEQQKLQVSLAMARWAAMRLQSWRALQELAGIKTPFTAKVRAETEAELGAAHEQQLAALRAEYEQKAAELQREQGAEMTRRVRDGLLSLAGYSGGKGASSSEKPS